MAQIELEIPEGLKPEDSAGMENDCKELIKLSNSYYSQIMEIVGDEISEQYAGWLEKMITAAKLGNYKTNITFHSTISFSQRSAQQMYEDVCLWLIFSTAMTDNAQYQLSLVSQYEDAAGSYINISIEWMPTDLLDHNLETYWENNWKPIIENASLNQENFATLTFDASEIYDTDNYPDYPERILINYLSQWLLNNQNIVVNSSFLRVANKIIDLEVSWTSNILDNSLSKQLENLRLEYKDNLYNTFEDTYHNDWENKLLSTARDQGFNFIELEYKDLTEFNNSQYLETYLNNIQLLLQTWWYAKDPDFIFKSSKNDINYENKTIKFNISWEK